MVGANLGWHECVRSPPLPALGRCQPWLARMCPKPPAADANQGWQRPDPPPVPKQGQSAIVRAWNRPRRWTVTWPTMQRSMRAWSRPWGASACWG
ncbi:hypothetical protein G6F35_016972 [Rhizopus arrhizus]|nr:hypothetical protein G6F35_016972 [Rhizopus arrhizus]